MNGVLLIDKPEGPTSADVVRILVRQLPSQKIGHLGTLDPFASGVLPVCVGEATKVARFLDDADKEYEGTIRLGAATDTGDRTGSIVRTSDVPAVDEQKLRDISSRFVGVYQQTPPMYSAVKHHGVPLYKLARKGIEVKRTARSVRILALHLSIGEPGTLHFRVTCSRGTYVRVLAEDIGVALGCAAYLESLRRTRFGRFGIDDCVPLYEWSPRCGAGRLTIRQALAFMPSIMLTEQQAACVRRGQVSILPHLGATVESNQAALIDPAGEVAAVIVRAGERWAFARVLGTGEDSLQTPGPVVGNKT